RARGRRSVGRGDERQPQGLGRGAHRHRLLRGDSDHHRHQDQGKRPRGGLRPGRGLRLRADRDAAEERGGGPGHQRRRVLQLLGALRDRDRRGRCAVPAAERPAGRLAGGRPAAAHPRRRADQRLLRGDGPRRGSQHRRRAARHRDRRRDRHRHRLHRAVPLAADGAPGPAPARRVTPVHPALIASLAAVGLLAGWPQRAVIARLDISPRPPALVLAAACWLAACAVPLAYADMAVQRLPDPLTGAAYAGTVVLLLLAAAVGGPWSALGPAFLRALLGGLALAGFYLLLMIISPPGMSLGDVKLAASLGTLLAWFGWR